MQQNPNTKLASIQGLRAVAAVSVALLHAIGEASNIAALGDPWHGAAPSRFAALGAGVDLFFVISGFVMVHAARDLFGASGGPLLFLGRRLARIVPLYWLTTTLFLLAGFAMPAALNSAAPSFGQILASYLFWPMTRADGLAQPVYGLGWTLNYEMFFYVLLAAAMGFRRTVAVALVSAMLMAFVVAGALLQPSRMPWAFWSDPIVLEFVFGAWIAMAYQAGWRLPEWMRVAFVIAAIELLAVDLSDELPRVVAWGLPAALLLSASVLVERESINGRLYSMLSAIGDASYALYLIHPFVIRPVGKLWLKLGLGAAMPNWIFLAVAVGLAIGVAMVVYRRFEWPLTMALNARLMPGTE